MEKICYETKIQKKMKGERKMKIVNSEKWKDLKAKNKSEYGSKIMFFAEKWADLMEVEIEKGSTVAEAAEATRHNTGITGMSGEQFSCATTSLYNCWEHGETLADWYDERIKC